MPFSSLEKSVSDSEPRELYLFTERTTGQEWRYHSGQVEDGNITFGAKIYTPAGIKRSKISNDSEEYKSKLDIDIYKNVQLVQELIQHINEYIVDITVYRLQSDDSSAIMWTGTVSAFESNQKASRFRCDPLPSSLNRSALFRTYSVSCPYFLYDDNTCRVSKPAFKVSGTVSSVSGLSIVSSSFATQPDGWFVGGTFETTLGQMMITSHTGNTITIQNSIRGLTAGYVFDAFAGCGHTTDDCKNKFSNLANYGGQPYIPDLNPFDGKGPIM